MPLKFYELQGGMIVCEPCLEKWKKETAEGKYRQDPENGYTKEAVLGPAETPAQCDECLEQSDDYDDVLEED